MIESLLTVGEQDDRRNPFWVRPHEQDEVRVTRSDTAMNTGQIDSYISGVTLVFKQYQYAVDYSAVL